MDSPLAGIVPDDDHEQAVETRVRAHPGAPRVPCSVRSGAERDARLLARTVGRLSREGAGHRQGGTPITVPQ
eukprot:5625536-Pyramimonas_sp.AAC.1